ncbi:S8 family serine peptidase [Geminicoccus flavidas]|uniref:S8 family serine peptidase n=1 Tax=Geminicoccus flavidas TaxID=2506407 RepID=UPI0038B247B4
MAIFDRGVEGNHPDLAANFDTEDGCDTESGKTGPGLPIREGDNHGTVVAGFAAEVGNNGVGGIGSPTAPRSSPTACRSARTIPIPIPTARMRITKPLASSSSSCRASTSPTIPGAES